jgi:hypothetical protein
MSHPFLLAYKSRRFCRRMVRYLSKDVAPPIHLMLWTRQLKHCRWKLGSQAVCPNCCVPPSSGDGDDNPYRWEFKLLLEDTEGDKLAVIVADEEAEHLLNLQADKSVPPTLCLV